MLTIRNSQFVAFADARRLEIRREFARCLESESGTPLRASPGDAALQHADAVIATGDIFGIHDLELLLRLNRLLGLLSPADHESGWPAAILSDPSVTDPRQRLLRAEDELQHRNQLQAANTRLAAQFRDAPAKKSPLF